MKNLAEKKEKLVRYLNRFTDGGVCLAFSGGIDSTLLLRLLSELKIRFIAVTFKSPLHSDKEIEEAREIAKSLGVEHEVIVEQEIYKPIENNPVNRCYLCKRHIFECLKKRAGELRLTHIIDGTNLDDIGEYRPGLKALEEMGVKSPLVEMGFTKVEVRELAKELGIIYHRKPSSPCLATRIPYGDMLSPVALYRIWMMEDKLKELGFKNLRARDHNGILRLELDLDELESALQKKDEIVVSAKSIGFRYVTLDLEGFRTGSMDVDI